MPMCFSRFSALGKLSTKILLVIIVVASALISRENGFEKYFYKHTPAETSLIISGTPEYSTCKSQLLPAPTPSVHASTLVELPDGRLMAAWFGGAREGAADVAIYASLCNRGANQWSKPVVLVDRSQMQRDVGRSIRKLGNPLLFVQDGRIHLFVVSVSYGGWSASSINHSFSDDFGQTWSRFHRLQLSPLLNISSLVRCTPVALSDGAMGIPVYHELINKYGEWLVLDKRGRVLDKARIPADNEALQPVVISLNQKEAVAFLRNGDTGGGKISVSRTTDAGISWEEGADLPIHNPDSGISALRLRDGSLLLAGNPSQGRSVLNLWKTKGARMDHWELVCQLENVPDKEFSYPCLIQDKNGNIHISYTWQRKQIKHVVFPIQANNMRLASTHSADSL